MKEHIHRSLLLSAVKLIWFWHDFNENLAGVPSVFHLYYQMAPEMQAIREALGPWDSIKDEVISATSESVG